MIFKYKTVLDEEKRLGRIQLTFAVEFSIDRFLNYKKEGKYKVFFFYFMSKDI